MVTVNDEPVERHGEYFWHLRPVTGGSAVAVLTQFISAVEPGGGPNGEDLVREHSGARLFQKDPKTIYHNNDGGYQKDDLCFYKYDGEDRLVEVVTRQDMGIPYAWHRRVAFTYDYLGRRTSIKVRAADPVTGAYSSATIKYQRFVYDGWQLIGELSGGLETNSGPGTWITRFVWGLDLSGSIGGAGGIGGLVFGETDTGIHGVGVDAQGNVTTLFEASTGSVTGEFDYGPFGEDLGANGVAAASWPIRFSSKYRDAVTGFYYYGYRFYYPTTGKWLTRDPLEEEGGLNLYGFVGNDPINAVDPWGLQAACDCASHTEYGCWWNHPALAKVFNAGGHVSQAVASGATAVAADIKADSRGATASKSQDVLSPITNAYKDANFAAAGMGMEGYGAGRSGVLSGVSSWLSGFFGFGAQSGSMGGGQAPSGSGASSPSAGGSPNDDDKHGLFAKRTRSDVSSCTSGPASSAAPTKPYNISTKGMTAAERRAIIEYAQRTNAWISQNGGTTVIQPTAGTLRSQANAAARNERMNAARAGSPYQGQAGHVPDTALTGMPDPPAGWLDMPGKSNSVTGGGLASQIGKTVDVITVDGEIP